MKKIAALSVLIFTFGIYAYAAAPEADIAYTFDNTLSDAEANGTVSYTDGVSEQAAYFENKAYLTLPEGIVSDASDFTVSAWVKPDEISSWARVFDFGTGTEKYMFLTLTNGSGTTFAITASGNSGEQKIVAPSTVFTVGEWTHIAVTKSGNSAVMYADGVEVGRNDNMTLSPSSLGTTALNYIAKSQYDDPYFNGCIDNFRIYRKGLTADEISELAGEPNNSIVSIEPVTLTIEANSEAELPDYAEAVFGDGAKRSVKVQWDGVDTSRDGVYNVSGTVMGTEVKASARVTVTSLSVTDGLTATAQLYSDSGKYIADYTIGNYSDIKKAIIFIAAYDGETLVGVGMKKIDELNNGIYSVEVSAPQSEDIMVKTYLWDMELKPLANCASKNFGNPYGSSFEVSEVKLTDGIFKTSQDLGLTVVKSLDVDRLLAPVAYNAGAITDKSEYYGGWEAYKYRTYSGTGISGHSLGHWMSAAADMYAVTDDSEVKEKLDYAVNKLAEYQEMNGDGYIGGVEESGFVKALSGTLSVSAFDLNGYWVPWYSFHKIYQGLIDAYELTGNEKALEVVRGFADWAINVTKDMEDDKFNQMLECEYGGMNEVMAELYDITGEKKYYDLAVRFTQPSIITPLSNETDELAGKHANTQIPKVIGAAAVFEQNEDRTDYKTAAKFFYDTVVNNRSYVIGGNSNSEHFSGVGDETLGTQTCETCNTYNMMKLAEHLYAWNHDAAYMDYYEKALFNHILASQDPESGMKTYFMATKQGHFKVYSTLENSFWCCFGSGMENPGRYTRNIYYKDNDDFYVNQFISSSVEWKEKGLTISQSTNYPYSDTTLISIDEGSADAKINIRIPSWLSEDATVTLVHGDAAEEPITVKATGEAYYYPIEGRWQKDDRIIVKLPMGLHTYTARDSKNKVAFMYGPVVLAGELGTESFPTTDLVSDHTSLDSFGSIEVPDIVVENKSPEAFITATDLSKLEFKLDTGSGIAITLIPYFNLHHERYSLYWYLYGEDEEREKDEFAAALDAATIDAVYIDGQQNELEHSLQSNNSHYGYLDSVSKTWRDAYGTDAYFSYEMKIDETAEKNYVMAVYLATDSGFSSGGVNYTRDFNILADGTVIGNQKLPASGSGLVYTYYEIPSDVISSAKDGKITVKFAPSGLNTAAGGVFEVRTTNAVVEKEQA